jgi:uncharacterized membrane protein YfcA
MPPPTVFLFLLLAALLAGFIDGAVGGGGLVSVPALFLCLPGHPTTTLLGTNKLVAVTGTTVAAAQFVRGRVVPLRETLAPMLGAGAGAALGATAAYSFEGSFEAAMRPLMLAVMAAMLAFTLLRPGMGTQGGPGAAAGGPRPLAAAGVSAAMGFYDGFFGPGTGALLIFLFVALLGLDFLRASAMSKAANWASNVASLALFASRGSWLPLVAAGMAAANGVGGYLGARAALARGSRWIRALFAVVVSCLMLRLAWDMAAERPPAAGHPPLAPGGAAPYNLAPARRRQKGPSMEIRRSMVVNSTPL